MYSENVSYKSYFYSFLPAFSEWLTAEYTQERFSSVMDTIGNWQHISLAPEYYQVRKDAYLEMERILQVCLWMNTIWCGICDTFYGSIFISLSARYTRLYLPDVTLLFERVYSFSATKGTRSQTQKVSTVNLYANDFGTLNPRTVRSRRTFLIWCNFWSETVKFFQAHNVWKFSLLS